MMTVAEDVPLFEEPGDLSMRRSRAIVRSYLVLTGLLTLAASLMWAVNALFLLDAGLDIFEVFVVNAAFTVGLVLFEIPTGVVADSTGRRRSFLLSVLILIIGTVGPDFDQLVRYSLPWSRCRVARMSSGSGSAAVTIWSPAWISMVW